MKKIILYTIPICVYLFLGAITFGNQEVLFPLTVVCIGILSSLNINDKNSIVENVLQNSLVITILFLISLLFNDVDKSIVFKYILSVISISFLVSLLKRKIYTAA